MIDIRGPLDCPDTLHIEGLEADLQLMLFELKLISIELSQPFLDSLPLDLALGFGLFLQILQKPDMLNEAFARSVGCE